MYPSPRTVRIASGFSGFTSILRRMPRDADVDRAVERVPGAVVGALEDLVAVQHPAAVVGEELQEVELHRRQRHLAAVLGEELRGGDVEPALAEAPALAA